MLQIEVLLPQHPCSREAALHWGDWAARPSGRQSTLRCSDPFLRWCEGCSRRPLAHPEGGFEEEGQGHLCSTPPLPPSGGHG